MVFLRFPRELDPLKYALAPTIDILKFQNVTCVCDFYAVRKIKYALFLLVDMG
jgi:hypothetical protein